LVFNIRYDECFDVLAKKLVRVHKKNAKKREKWAGFGAHSGEMERNLLVATCEHNYGATFSRGRTRREHIVLR
jgi:hypothetical protein